MEKDNKKQETDGNVSELSGLLGDTKTCKHENKLFDGSRICRDCGSVIIISNE